MEEASVEEHGGKQGSIDRKRVGDEGSIGEFKRDEAVETDKMHPLFQTQSELIEEDRPIGDNQRDGNQGKPFSGDVIS